MLVAESGPRQDQSRNDASIEFGEDLWSQIESCAARMQVTPAEYVRAAVRGAVTGDESLELLAGRVWVAVADHSGGSQREVQAGTVARGGEAVYSASADWRMIRALADTRLRHAIMTLAEWLERIVHPADEPRVVATIEAARRDKSPFEMEHRSLRADRTVVNARLSAVPLDRGGGAISEWLVALRHE